MSDTENPNTQEEVPVEEVPVELTEEEKKKQQLKLITYLVGQKIQILNNMLKQKGLETPLEDTAEKFKSFGLLKDD